MTAASLRCAKSPYGRAGILGVFSVPKMSLPASHPLLRRSLSSPAPAASTSQPQQISSTRWQAGPSSGSPHSMGHPLVPCGVPVVLATSARGPRNLLSCAGHQPSPTSRTLLPGRRPLARHAQGSELRPPPPILKGTRQSTKAGVRRGPWASPQRGLGSHRRPPEARCSSRPLNFSPGDALNSSPWVQGQAPVRAEAAPSPSRKEVWGARFRLCRFAPDQAIPICVDCPAGSRGELFVRILC
ncbi:hypothetical protein NDU88_006636 [Pleurodeles waltl]|uniref:Uncharacterized protein n=1 Tax=Pleurodeles waltl TaxID=8319 RepID=A0AAV7RPJ0_PLEWA|nr:hypothetical protein NDU88_006636 [Pleurodeles waltl]